MDGYINEKGELVIDIPKNSFQNIIINQIDIEKELEEIKKDKLKKAREYAPRIFTKDKIKNNKEYFVPKDDVEEQEDLYECVIKQLEEQNQKLIKYFEKNK